MPEAVSKYVKPKSLTWWASVVPLIAGLALAVSSAVPGFEALNGLLQGFFPEATAVELINVGLIGIGLRGAIK
jgi:hypothetical protein